MRCRGPAPRRRHVRARDARRLQPSASGVGLRRSTGPGQFRASISGPRAGPSATPAEPPAGRADHAGRGPRGPRARGSAAARALPPRRRRGSPRGARRALPAARPPARPALPARRRAARRPRPGRLARAAQGDRPLRPRARDGVLLVRRADHPRRAQAPLPRQGLVRPRPARPAGAGRQGRPRRRADRQRARPRARRRPRSPRRSARRTEQVLEAREAAGAYRAVSLDRPRDEEEDDATGIADSVGAEDPGFSPRRGRRDRRAADARAHRPRARGAAPALRGGPHAVGDRRARRRLPDARLAADPPVGRAPARGRRDQRHAAAPAAEPATPDARR